MRHPRLEEVQHKGVRALQNHTAAAGCAMSPICQSLLPARGDCSVTTHTPEGMQPTFGGGGGGGRVCTTLHPPPGCTCLRLTASSVGSSSHPQTCCSKCQLGHAALPCSASRATGVDNPPGAQVHGCVVMPLPLRCHDGDTSSFRGAQGSCCSCCLLMLSTGMLPCSLLLCNHHCV